MRAARMLCAQEAELVLCGRDCVHHDSEEALSIATFSGIGYIALPRLLYINIDTVQRTDYANYGRTTETPKLSRPN